MAKGLEIINDLGGNTEPSPTTEPQADDQTFGFRGAGGIEYQIPETIKAGDHDLNVKALLGHVISQSRKAAQEKAEKQYQDKFNPLSEAIKNKDAQISEISIKLQELEDAQLTADEKAKKDAQREIDKIKLTIEASEKLAATNWDLYKENKIDNDILVAMSGYDLTNAGQTKQLLRLEGKADLVPIDGINKTILKLNIDGEIVDMTPKEAVEKYLAMPGNAHHLKNNLLSGGGSSSVVGSANASGEIQYTRTQMEGSREIREEYMKKSKAGEKVVIIDN